MKNLHHKIWIPSDQMPPNYCTLASHLVMPGKTLKAALELLGPIDIEMTMRSAPLAPGHLEDAVNALNDWGRKTMGNVGETCPRKRKRLAPSQMLTP